MAYLLSVIHVVSGNLIRVGIKLTLNSFSFFSLCIHNIFFKSNSRTSLVYKIKDKLYNSVPTIPIPNRRKIVETYAKLKTMIQIIHERSLSLLNLQKWRCTFYSFSVSCVDLSRKLSSVEFPIAVTEIMGNSGLLKYEIQLNSFEIYSWFLSL